MTIVKSGDRELVLAGGRDAERLLRLAENAHLPSEVDAVLTLMERVSGPITWLPFGGRNRVAHSAIGSASSSTHLLTEPLTNILDGELELAHQLALRAGDDYVPQSTYEAAERYFGVPSGGLPAWNARRGADQRRFRELAMRAQVQLHLGSAPETPSITYLDWAIGQHPTAFERTLLSLHLGNKADIPYLSGQYGHGAGLTLAFSGGGQMIIARRHPDLLPDAEDDLVGLTLIVRRMPSETGMANPSYWYAVPEATESVLAFAPSALSDPRWHGVRRTCVDYELAKHSERDIYFALDHYFPEPALPYAFHDVRQHGENWQWRYMAGNSSRLEGHFRGWTAPTGKNPTRVPYRQRTFIDLTAWINDGNDYGAVELTTTFVRQPGTNRGNELFSPVKEAEVWTVNGQVHHSRSRLHFGLEPIRLDAIRDYLIVEVKLDGLSPDAKALLLTTDRQGAAERRIRTQLEAAVDDVLASDEALRALNDEVKDEALRQAADSRMKDLDRELAELEMFFGYERKTIKRKVKQLVQRIKRPRPDIKPLAPITPLHADPTFLRFRRGNRDVMRVQPGATASMLLEADAIDGYFNSERQPTWQFLPPMGTALRVYSSETLTGGRMRVRIKAAPTAALGSTQLTATYLPANAQAPLSDSIPVEIVAVTPRAPRGSQGPTIQVEVEIEEEVERPKTPNYLWVYAERSPTWAEHALDWDYETIAEFKHDVAFLNGDFPPLQNLLNDGRSAQAQQYLSLYAAPVIMTLVGLAKEATDPPRDDEGEPILLHDAYRDAALRGVALSTIFTIRKLKRLGLVGGEQPDED